MNIPKTRLRMVLIAVFLMFGLALSVSAPIALADTSSTDVLQGGIDAASKASGSTDTTKPINNTISTVINILGVAIGVVAVIMLMVGGFRYITSAGVAEKTATAKKTILYALIGLAVVALSQTIAKFVLDKADTTNSTSNTTGSTGTIQGSGGSPP